nr:MAG TPA: hypothetical protein [Bacteriophage sp.]
MFHIIPLQKNAKLVLTRHLREILQLMIQEKER